MTGRHPSPWTLARVAFFVVVVALILEQIA